MKTGSAMEGANGPVTNIITQDDGKILIIGKFTKIRGQKYYKFARLNPNGDLDLSFSKQPIKGASAYSDPYHSIAMQRDGKILIGGVFPNYLARLNPDGSQDKSFKPFEKRTNLGIVRTIAVQKNGGIVVGYSLSDNVSWITPEGEIVAKKDFKKIEDVTDKLVNLFEKSPVDVKVLVTQDDGKVIVGADISEMITASLKQPSSNIFRLNPDGSLDTSLDLRIKAELIHDLALLSDGSIMLAGRIKKIGETKQASGLCMVKFDKNGNIDRSFSLEVKGDVFKLLLQPDGKIVIGGMFKKIGDKLWMNIARLNPDGSLDPTFFSAEWKYLSLVGVTALALQPDGKILAGGVFKIINGEKRERIARLNSDGTVDQSF